MLPVTDRGAELLSSSRCNSASALATAVRPQLTSESKPRSHVVLTVCNAWQLQLFDQPAKQFPFEQLPNQYQLQKTKSLAPSVFPKSSSAELDKTGLEVLRLLIWLQNQVWCQATHGERRGENTASRKASL